MNKINLKTYLKKRKQRLSLLGASPSFDWLVIFSLATLILIGGIISASYLYVQVNNGSLFEIDEDTSEQAEFENKKINIQKKVEVLKQRSFDERPVN